MENFKLPLPVSGKVSSELPSTILGDSLSKSKILFPAVTLDGISDKNHAVIRNGHNNRKTYWVKAIKSPNVINSFIDKYPPRSKTSKVITIGISSNIGTNFVLRSRYSSDVL